MNYRDFLQKIIYYCIDPVVRLLAWLHITPNMVTFGGFVGNVVAAALFILAASQQCGFHAMTLVGWGGAIVLFAGLFDMLDGRLARVSGQSSRFGALWDSTLDRYSELVTLGGIAYYFLATGLSVTGIWTFAALVGSVMVSYVRARAEAIGIECKVGLMQRPERVVLTALGAIATALTLDILWLAAAMAIIALLANATAFYRVWHCYKQLRDDR
jgi:CDP-diacylglycerol--glycerol-3-phosphate 3-phosphatidyltransferase